MNADHWQKQFSHSLMNGLVESLPASFGVKNHSQHQQRFAIYQNNVFYSLTQALGELYPVVKRLVGDDFFKPLAKAYIAQCPPKQAAMVFFAWDFPEFIKAFEHTQDLPYLAGVAELELARHKAYHAADRQALTSSDFGSIQADELGSAYLELHSSFQLVESQHPIFSVWQDNQSDNSASPIDLSTPERVIIVRYRYEVILFAVDLGTYEFYRCLQQGLSVNEAANNALQVMDDSDTNIPHAIALGINNGFIGQIKY